MSAGKNLTTSDVEKLNSVINANDSWSLLNNCSSFAAKVWNYVAKTQLSAGTPNNPAALATSIKNKLGYVSNRNIPKKDSSYLYYHTSSSKVSCSNPSFTGGSSSSSFKTIDSNNTLIDNINAQEFITSFPKQ